MKIGEVIAAVDELKPNTLDEDRKRSWIWELELHVMDFLKGFESPHAGEGLHESKTQKEPKTQKESDEEKGYSGLEIPEDDVELLVPAPFDSVYRFYVESQVDYANGEIEKYNNSRAMYNNMLSEYENHYRRHHMPKGRKVKLY